MNTIFFTNSLNLNIYEAQMEALLDTFIKGSKSQLTTEEKKIV